VELKHLKSHEFLVLTADTIVEIGGRILGKPSTAAEAAEFLDLLSGQKHRVITALSLLDLDQGRRALDHEVTEVNFRKLTPQEIQEYVATGEPMDKAGAYGIQGAAKVFVENIVGPLDNVIGLPVKLFEKLLVENGWQLR
jgi:septum formation protein